MSSRTSIRVAVLMGGPSKEREVSLVTGRQCAAALVEEGYEAIEVVAGGDLPSQLREIKPDVAFNALHGRWGEDGCAQGILEWMQIPYTHSGVLASSTAMNKDRTKEVYRAAGLPSPAGHVLPTSEVRAAHPIQPPYVVKPVNEGSSVGVYIVPQESESPAPLGSDMPSEVLVEEFIPGLELTVSVLQGSALTVTDIRTDAWYDYRAKYETGGSTHVVPAAIPAGIFDACMDFALSAHNSLGCRGLTRTDFRWDERYGVDGLKLLETNTQPGMTPTSLSPEQASHCGISFGSLCRILVEDASCDR